MKIESTVELPELHPGQGPADVVIRLKQVPHRAQPPNRLDVRPRHVEFMAWNIQYTITGGSLIEIEAPEDIALADIRIYLLGSIMAALLHQRGYLPIHANVVRQAGYAAAFAGESGAGKSTLAAWLEARGHEVLSDDLCAVRFDSGHPCVCEGIPRMKLWSDTLRAFGRDEHGLSRVATNMNKFHVPLRRAGAVGSLDPLPLRRIYLLERAGAETSAGVERLTGVQAAQAILANAFTWQLGQKILEDPRAQFDQCLAVARNAAVFRVRRRWDMGVFSEDAEMIERHLNMPLETE